MPPTEPTDIRTDAARLADQAPDCAPLIVGGTGQGKTSPAAALLGGMPGQGKSNALWRLTALAPRLTPRRRTAGHPMNGQQAAPPTPAAEQVAAAFTAVADMVTQLGIVALEVTTWTDWEGTLHVELQPAFDYADPAGLRARIDAIARWIDADLHAGHSRGDLWNVSGRGTLGPTTIAHIHQRIRGRQNVLDLAPLPTRNRTRQAAG